LLAPWLHAFEILVRPAPTDIGWSYGPDRRLKQHPLTGAPSRQDAPKNDASEAVP